jgi:hypothetical protein
MNDDDDGKMFEIVLIWIVCIGICVLFWRAIIYGLLSIGV